VADKAKRHRARDMKGVKSKMKPLGPWVEKSIKKRSDEKFM